MPGASPPVVFAFDAGATSTRAVAVDEAGTVLWRGAAPGASVSRLGVEGAAGIVNGLWRKAVEEAGTDVVGTLPAAVAGGFAGARSSRVQDEVARAVSRLLGLDDEDRSTPVSITHDAHIALIGAVGEEGPGCVVISGTGSICMARDEGGAVMLAGGWGWPLGDEGSATWVGWRAVGMGLAAWEDGEPSELTGLVLEAWDLKESKGSGQHDVMLSAVEASREPARYAALAPRVYEIALQGNPDATALVAETGEALGRLIESAYRRLGTQPGGRFPLAFMGSLAEAWRIELEEPVRRGAGPYGKDIQIVPALLPAHGGAVLMAFRAAGIAPRPGAIERLSGELAC